MTVYWMLDQTSIRRRFNSLTFRRLVRLLINRPCSTAAPRFRNPQDWSLLTTGWVPWMKSGDEAAWRSCMRARCAGALYRWNWLSWFPVFDFTKNMKYADDKKFINTREAPDNNFAGACLCVCLSVCLYVCNTITFESLNIQSSFLAYGDILGDTVQGRIPVWRLSAQGQGHSSKKCELPYFRNVKLHSVNK